MPSSSRILRGLAVKGWKTYYPRQGEGEVSVKEKEPSPDMPSVAEPPQPSKEEIEEERKAILQQAREEGEEQRRKIIDLARQEAEKLREQAQRDGFAKGRQEGEKAAEKMKDEARKKLEKAHQQYEAILADAEPEMIRIAVNLAEKLLNTQLEINEGLIVGIVSRCLEALPGGQEVIVRVNPHDEALCREKLDILRTLLKSDTVLEIRGDIEIQPGSCRVDTEEAEVTFNLSRELQALLKKLLTLAT
ncbi:MAG TPA: hypothetical protein GXZ24_04205 [Firmicutes bacterium]|jgi:flagellar assembly protein FliH|nr:hypothetical protein [Bacillota bacterium]